MAEVRWTPQGVDDLESIAHFIAKDSPHYARLFVPEIKNSRIREIILGQYRIVYRLQARVSEILTIYHGARLLNPSKLR